MTFCGRVDATHSVTIILSNRHNMHTTNTCPPTKATQDFFTSALPEALDVALRSRKNEHGGMPVGVLCVQKKDIADLRKRLEAAFGKFNLSRVDRVTADLVLMHLPVNVAGALDDPAAAPEAASELVATLIADGSIATYYSGVRTQDAALGRPLARPPPVSGARFTFAEIFAGVGGFRLGLEPLGGRGVFASEIEKWAMKAYQTHFPADGALMVGDISGVYASSLPAVDLLTAGFPCQPFSDRGRRPGLLDDRGQLYRELVRLLIARQPAAFLFENVSGLVTMEGGSRSMRGERRAADVAETSDHFTPGATFTRILAELTACGYRVSWRVLSSRHWLAQHRERVYIVGFRTNLGVERMEWEADAS